MSRCIWLEFEAISLKSSAAADHQSIKLHIINNPLSLPAHVIYHWLVQGARTLTRSGFLARCSCLSPVLCWSMTVQFLSLRQFSWCTCLVSIDLYCTTTSFCPLLHLHFPFWEICDRFLRFWIYYWTERQLTEKDMSVQNFRQLDLAIY